MVVHEVLHESDARYEGWRVAFASAVSWFLASSLIYTFAVFFKPLAAEFSWSREVVASAYGLMAITSAISAPLFGFALDRSGVRRVIVPCMAIVGVAFGSLALLTARQWQFYATFALLGIVGTGLSPVGYSRAVSTWFDKAPGNGPRVGHQRRSRRGHRAAARSSRSHRRGGLENRLRHRRSHPIGDW